MFFYVKTVKNRWRLGDTPPDPLGQPASAEGFTPRPLVMDPLCEIVGATQALHIIFAYYCYVDDTEMKDTN